MNIPISLTEIKNAYAKQHGWESWSAMVDYCHSNNQLKMFSKFECDFEKHVGLVFTLEDVIKSAKYGFDYRAESQNDGNIPIGNILQWLMERKHLLLLPDEFKKLKAGNGV